MNLADVAAIGSQHAATAAPAQVARELDALVFGLLWRCASVPGAVKHRAESQQATGQLGELFAQQLAVGYAAGSDARQLAVRHSTGFGAMLLRAIDSTGQ